MHRASQTQNTSNVPVSQNVQYSTRDALHCVIQPHASAVVTRPVPDKLLRGVVQIAESVTCPVFSMWSSSSGTESLPRPLLNLTLNDHITVLPGGYVQYLITASIVYVYFLFRFADDAREIETGSCFVSAVDIIIYEGVHLVVLRVLPSCDNNSAHLLRQLGSPQKNFFRPHRYFGSGTIWTARLDPCFQSVSESTLQ